MSAQHPFQAPGRKPVTCSSSISPSSKLPSTGPRVFSITSGKGGVGKTSITANLAVELAKLGHEVCIFDADTGLANINILLGLSPKFTLEHVLSGEKTIDEIVLYGPGGVTVVPASSGIAACADLDARQRRKLVGALRTLEEHFDYLLIDTAAGIHRSVLDFVQSASDMILVITPEPTSLTDAFAMLKVLKQDKFQQTVYVLVNTVANFVGSMEVFQRFADAVKKYLSIKVRYLGYVANDEAVPLSVKNQRPVALAEPEAPASYCFQALAQGLYQHFNGSVEVNSFSSYWEKLAEARTSSRTSSTAIASVKTAARTEKKVFTLAQISDHLSATLNKGDFSQQELHDFNRRFTALMEFQTQQVPVKKSEPESEPESGPDSRQAPVKESGRSSVQTDFKLDEDIRGLIDSIKYASLLSYVEEVRRDFSQNKPDISQSKPDVSQSKPERRRKPRASSLSDVAEMALKPSQQEVNLRNAFRKMTNNAIKTGHW